MKECVVCHHSIDDQAKICVFCNSDPETGDRFDAKPLLDEHFSKKQELGTGELLLEYFRQRQTIVVISVIAVLVLALFALHRWSTLRNEAASAAGPGVPLTEVADVQSGSQDTEIPMPELQFQFAGNPRSMRTYTIEPGAVPPPEVVQQQLPATNSASQPATPMLPRRDVQPQPQLQFPQGLPLGLPSFPAAPQQQQQPPAKRH